MGNLGGTYNLGYFDGGNQWAGGGGTNRGVLQSAVFKKLSKNPLKLRLVWPHNRPTMGPIWPRGRGKGYPKINENIKKKKKRKREKLK